MKGKFVSHKRKVLMVWTGQAFGLGKPLKPKVFACAYSSRAHAILLSKGVTFSNRFVDAYPFPGHYEKPRDCQKDMLEFALQHKRCYDLGEMRVGKSGPVVWEIDVQRKYNGLKRFIILAPLSTLEDTWKTELFGIMPGVATFYSTQGGTAALKKALLKGKHSVFVINFDKLFRCLDELLAFDPDMVFLDEASDFNAHDTRKASALEVLLKNKRRRFKALTGTPIPNRPTDVWSIARFINPNTPKTWHQLRNKTMYKLPHSQYKWVAKKEAKQIVGELMQPSIRFKTDDVNDMPDHEGMSVHTGLSKKQEQMFKEMKRDLITEDKGQVITAVHAGAKLWKLLQIASGVCYDETGKPVIIGAQPKMDEVKRLIREASGKTVIMCKFTSVQTYIIEQLRKDYRVGLINGKVKAKDRKKLIDGFQGDKLDVLVMHPGPTKYGLKLHAASQMIWFGPTYSAMEFEQGCARIRGPGTGKTVYIKLSACELEQEIFQLIDGRMRDQQETMNIAQGLKQAYNTILES